MFDSVESPRCPAITDTIVCTIVPRFALRVAAGHEGRLPDQPLALGPEPGGPPHIGEANAAAAAHGVNAGMRVGEAVARCPRLQLITPDPGAVAAADEELLDRLEQLGAAVEPIAPGASLFAADGLIRLHRGTLRLLQTVSGALPAGGRVGAGPGRFIARAAAGKARPRRPFTVEPGAAASFLSPLGVGQLHLEPALFAQLAALGIATIGDLASLPAARPLPIALAGRESKPGAWPGARTKPTSSPASRPSRCAR